MPGTAVNHNEPRETDPFNDAMTDEPQKFFGRVDVNAWTCVLEAGVGKVAYDPALHSGRRTSTCIEFSIAPIDPTHKLIARNSLNWSPDFKGIIRPSIEALAEQIAAIKNLTVGQFNPLKEISEMWVSGEFVPRPDNKEGETWTTLKFEAVYATEAACAAAAGVDDPSEPVPGFEEGAPRQDAPPDSMRQAMAAFLPAMYVQVGSDHDAFVEMIANNPALSMHFDADSPEVVAIAGEKAPF